MSLERLLEQNKNKDSGIRVPDNWEDFAYSSDKFAIPEQYKQYIDHVMLPRGLVMDRTEKMGNLSKRKLRIPCVGTFQNVVRNSSPSTRSNYSRLSLDRNVC